MVADVQNAKKSTVDGQKTEKAAENSGRLSTAHALAPGVLL